MNKGKPNLQNNFSYMLAAAHRNVQKSLSAQLKTMGLQIETCRIMEILDGEQEVAMGTLAKLALMNPPTLTKMVDRMVAGGLVQRQIALADNRQIHLVITQLGKKRIQEARRTIAHQNECITDAIGSEDLDKIMHVLSGIAHINTNSLPTSN